MCSVDYNFSYKLSFRHNICCFYLTWTDVTCQFSSVRFLLPTKPFCCTKLVGGWFHIDVKFSQMNDVLNGYFWLIFHCACTEIVITVFLVLKLNPKLRSSCPVLYRSYFFANLLTFKTIFAVHAQKRPQMYFQLQILPQIIYYIYGRYYETIYTYTESRTN